MADDRLERKPEAFGPDGHEPGETFRNLDAGKTLLARRVVAHHDAQAQRQTRDVRERLAGADRERREHGVDLAPEDPLELLELSRSRVFHGADADPFGGQGGTELLAPELGLDGAQLERANADLFERLLRGPAVRQADGETRDHLVVQPGDPDHEELVDDVGDDPAELHAFEQRLRRIGRKVEHPRHQGDCRELAVDQRFTGARSLGGRHRDRMIGAGL